MDLVSKKISFNNGLEGISISRDSSIQRLPEGTVQAPPPEIQTESLLEKLLGAPSFDSMLMSSLRPDISNRSILLPNVYEKVRAEIRGALSKFIKDTSDKKKKKRITSAQETLDEDEELAEGVKNSLYALYKI